AQLIAATFAVAMALIQDRHVQVEFFMMLFPKRLQAIVNALVQLILLVFFILIVWRLFVHGYHLQSGGEETATVRLPMAPFSYAGAVAIIPVCLVYLQQFIHSILRAMKNES
ncbi:MAG: TRAP transporter small permease, partial [Pseudomonadota bacterium]